MDEKKLVSVIITTRNSSRTLDRCLSTISKQSYKNIELIVVDNNSDDDTKKIARKYTKKVFNKGPERSAQRNFGAKKARGKYLYFVDADFVLERDVVKQCVEKIRDYDAVVVHNTPDETISWIAKVRKFEVDMYKYDLSHSAARFFKREVFIDIGGYNEKVTAGEDYDIQNRLNRKKYKTGFVDAEAVHLGEPTNFWKHMMNYYNYGKDFVNYKRYNKQESGRQLGFFRQIYFKNWKNFVKHPFLSVKFIFYHMAKFGFGGVGFVVGKLS